jgi:DNA-directed RNA polymerase specialized sigma24 family protein
MFQRGTFFSAERFRSGTKIKRHGSRESCMTLSTRIAPFLPYLRRYSRALTGSQTSGDAYVAAVLEALIADPTIFPEASNDKVALFRLFTALFGSSSMLVPEPASPFAWEQRASVNLAAVSPLARQSFLLVSDSAPERLRKFSTSIPTSLVHSSIARRGKSPARSQPIS